MHQFLRFHLAPMLFIHEGNWQKYLGNSFINPKNGACKCWMIWYDLFLVNIQWCIEAGFNWLLISCLHLFPTPSSYSMIGHLRLAIVGVFNPWKWTKPTNRGSPHSSLLLNTYKHIAACLVITLDQKKICLLKLFY
jgi:hypothetical protein